MITKELQINDHVVNGCGETAIIKKINKGTYTVSYSLNGIEETIRKDGFPYGFFGAEWFECDDAFDQLITNIKEENSSLKEKIYDAKKCLTVLGQVKHLLNQCDDIEEIEAEEE